MTAEPIITGDPESLPPARGRAVAIGTFDGVHVGHKAVIAATMGLGLRRTVVTFDPHPRTVLGKDVSRLCSLDRRIELLAAAGADEVLILPFSTDMAQMAAADWFERYLRPIGTEFVAVGAGFRFGHGRLGTADMLRSLGPVVREVSPVRGVSSTFVRDLIGRGELQRACSLLGRPHEIDLAVTRDGRTAAGPGGLVSTTTGLAVPPGGSYEGRLVVLGAGRDDSPGVNWGRTARVDVQGTAAQARIRVRTEVTPCRPGQAMRVLFPRDARLRAPRAQLRACKPTIKGAEPHV